MKKLLFTGLALLAPVRAEIGLGEKFLLSSESDIVVALVRFHDPGGTRKAKSTPEETAKVSVGDKIDTYFKDSIEVLKVVYLDPAIGVGDTSFFKNEDVLKIKNVWMKYVEPGKDFPFVRSVPIEEAECFIVLKYNRSLGAPFFILEMEFPASDEKSIGDAISERSERDGIIKKIRYEYMLKMAGEMGHEDE